MQGVIFEASGVSRTLRFDFNALCALESETGKTIDQVGELLQPAGGGAPRVTDLRLLFWAGLGGRMTKEEAGDIMSDLGFVQAAALIASAFNAAFPEMGDLGGDEAASGNAVGTAA